MTNCFSFALNYGLVESLPESVYTNFLSDVAKSRLPSPIRSLFPLEATPGMISLLAGKPNPASFPFTSFSFTARAPPGDPSGVPRTEEDIAVSLSNADLAAALQYGPTNGFPALVDWFYQLQSVVHGRERGEGWSLSIGNGSQDLVSKAIVALLNPGDPVLVQSPVYAGVIPLFHSLQCKQIEVEADADGISSDALRSILEQWPTSSPKPKILYTIPYGGNPTGATASIQRRQEVLALARDHNLLIIEDDPYYYLYFGPSASRPPSYFAMERSDPSCDGQAVGRVLRLDSLSKVLSAGLRIGVVSGPSPIIRAIDAHTATANLQPAGLTQAVAAALMNSPTWGHSGFLRHVDSVASLYKAKRDVFEEALQRHLGKDGLAEWSTPQAGLFFWFRLIAADGDGDSAALVRTKAFERGVLALPGTVFLPDGRKTGYVRAAFSLLGPEEVDEAMKRLAQAVRDAAAQ
ncbi:PLP-dependent transferase [Mycena indigotica]|uniref:PLP-dependent transferase n=1 Tax=Mycena indigotica TaxID=2126181 RepID=A0A8H6T605_9AGAR|nr:PLP-dependent transferase [Mycena indigotica]KAF7312725.1 PLP-dependent transferase [Mycena indigotica]